MPSRHAVQGGSPWLGARHAPALLNRGYGRAFFWDGPLFRAVFDREPHAEDLARSHSSYVRTMLAGNAPIDRYFAGEPRALAAEQLEGLEVFRGKGRCTVCHGGPTFTDERFHNTGVAWRDGALVDSGRAAFTLDERDRGGRPNPTLDQDIRTGRLAFPIASGRRNVVMSGLAPAHGKRPYL